MCYSTVISHSKLYFQMSWFIWYLILISQLMKHQPAKVSSLLLVLFLCFLTCQTFSVNILSTILYCSLFSIPYIVLYLRLYVFCLSSLFFLSPFFFIQRLEKRENVIQNSYIGTGWRTYYSNTPIICIRCNRI